MTTTPHDDFARDRLTQDEEELIMNLSPIYQQRREDWKQEGQRIIIESLLQERFGAIDAELSALIDQLTTLPTSQYMRRLLQASRDEILAHFPANSTRRTRVKPQSKPPEGIGNE
jgi:hypothetical protein